MSCPTCGVALPADARFCIECGAELPQAAQTGATVALRPLPADAVRCRACGAGSPADADYCVRCGKQLAEAPPPPLAAPAPPVLHPRVARQHTAPHPRPVRHRRRSRAFAERVGWASFLIGLGMLFLLKLPFWPAILIVCGVSAALGAIAKGKALHGLDNGIWLVGLAFLFMAPARYFVPGIIILIGTSIFLGALRRHMRTP